MNEVEVIAIVSMLCGLFGFLGYLGFLAHTNNSKNLKKDYLVIESHSNCNKCNKGGCYETAEVENNSSDKDSANFRKVVRVNGIGKQICNKGK